MDDNLRSELVGTSGLLLGAGVALLLTVIRAPVAARVHERHRTTLLFAVGLVLQVLHFSEEYSTGFYQRFPPVLGLSPWPADFFVVFNVGWLVVWTGAAFGLWAGYRPAFLPAWFFAIAAVGNLIAHPLLAIWAGGYFPGLVTSPLVGVTGLWLFSRLMAITEPRGDPASRSAWREVVLFIETVIFTVVVPGAVTLWIPRDLLGIWGDVPPRSWTIWQVGAILPLTVGLGVYLRCLWEFAVRGRGIPAPVDHPKQLVVTGLYRYVRNPMYVGVLLVLIGEAMFFRSRAFLLYAGGWLLFIHLNVILYEEPSLRRKFGSSYERYTLAVQRWIPGRPYREAGK